MTPKWRNEENHISIQSIIVSLINETEVRLCPQTSRRQENSKWGKHDQLSSVLQKVFREIKNFSVLNCTSFSAENIYKKDDKIMSSTMWQ